MRVQLADGTTLDCEDEQLGEGTGGVVYRARHSAHVVKLFKKPTAELRGAMEKILGEYNCVANEPYWQDLFCWPDGLVVSPSLGIRVPAFPRHYKSLASFVLGPRNYARLPPSEKLWQSRMLAALRLARGVGRLHRIGLAHSDLSPNNVCFEPREGRIAIIDLDGLVVRGFLPPQVEGTPGYIAPEIGERRATASPQTDLHALAVLIYELLLYRHPLKGPKVFSQDPDEDTRLQLGSSGVYIDHPTDRRNRPRRGFWPARLFGEMLARLFERAFVDGLKDPRARPTAAEWESAIARLSDRVVRCTNPRCNEKGFPITDGVAMVCPWCQTPWKVRTSIPALRLCRGDHRGQFQIEQDWWVAGFDGRTLHHWHTEIGVEAGPRVDAAPLARIEHRHDGWSLANVALDHLRPVRGGAPDARVPVGGRVPLTDGAVLLLGPPAKCRAVFVQLIQPK